MCWLLCSLVAGSLFKAGTLLGIYLLPDSHSKRQANKESHQWPRACWCQVSPPVTGLRFLLCWKPSHPLNAQCVAIQSTKVKQQKICHWRVFTLKKNKENINCSIVALNLIGVLGFCADQMDMRSSETKHGSIIALLPICFSTISFQYVSPGPLNCCARHEVISKSKQQKKDAETPPLLKYAEVRRRPELRCTEF